MSSPHVYDTIKAAIVAGVAYPVIDFDQIEETLQQGSDIFIALEEIVGEDVMLSFGNPDSVCTRENGSIIVHCFTPAPESSQASRVVAQEIKELFFHSQTIDGVRVVSVTPPDVELSNDGLWGAGSVAIIFAYDQYRATT